ncbi:hypothetical protein K6U06_02130 [Acidiferrimicrobium sp. IK]|uniref:RsiG family protein n=1 Tax=Acidiferrimicrobium sp. IK TaxID=2871700 RepID=UPI0021CB3FF4|nr:hypothetical protein [Acidiferrimicrobium sp. IK]MCU4183142.1 hypothetical protein [Acidiferrimicrobium sp. IK]
MAELTVEEILAPGYLEGLAGLPLPEVRARRDAANEVETGLSYLRRMVQGRLDIVLAEQQRRSAGLPPEDLARLVDRLPEILGEHVHAPGLGRLTTIIAPGQIDAELLARIEAVVTTANMSRLPDMSDADVAAISAGLEAVEREVSGQRRSLHEVLDALQEEIVRRYKSGEASVDTLLE